GRALGEFLRAAECLERLHRRLEPGPAIHEKVVAFFYDGDKAELVFDGHSFQPEGGIRLAFEHSDSRVCLRTGDRRELDVAPGRSVFAEDVFKQHLTARLRLPRNDAASLQVDQSID